MELDTIITDMAMVTERIITDMAMVTERIITDMAMVTERIITDMLTKTIITTDMDRAKRATEREMERTCTESQVLGTDIHVTKTK
jgi:hypothetical protein